MMIKIESDFDNGNISVVGALSPGNIQIEIEKDGAADFYQYFNFQVCDAKDTALTMNIKNAGSASYVDGWKGYNTCASYDQENWFRVETSFDGKTLTISHTPESDVVFYAYFAAYSYDRYQKFTGEMLETGAFDHKIIGETLDGRAIDYFQIGDGDKPYWVIARQHPGETMGSWWMEGFLSALAEKTDPAVEALVNNVRLHIIPCMNLDGAYRGHLRTNAAGIDLNRAWRNTTMEKSPEVCLVRENMRDTGVDFFLDVHGDEAIANNFLDAAYGIPSWDDIHDQRFKRFSDALLETSKDFQDKEGYPKPPEGKANLDIATNYVAETWGCLAMTLEMPFKDAKVNAMPDVGWSPERCRTFAVEHIKVMAGVSGN